ncbi:MAG: hypothetical protein JSU62_02180 [Gammaproteobacteria bacterium]|nr:MAG: hypothetical protein JSU62_02180 [Gammaproteobacteria bacterium]
MPDTETQEAIALMMRFAERTGLASGHSAQRYLWTDAFAVCNFVGLARATADQHYQELALRLVDQVHHSLGRHRADDRRRGWISGLGEHEGEAHPTRGGLRIGKELPERGVREPFDERLEWERDGQYFHYLTKWMQALDQVTRATGQSQFNRWARELADSAYRAFSYRPFAAAGPRRMYWKMSIDLSRPLVSSMGQHDALDGYITALQLAATATGLPDPVTDPDLDAATRGFAGMIKGGDWASADPLGIGGLLMDAYRVQQLMQHGAVTDQRLLERLLKASLTGLQVYANSREMELPAGHRLAFRELGLAIGLQAVERMWQTLQRGPASISSRSAIRTLLQALMQFVPLAEGLVTFWRDPAHQDTPSWAEHRDINEVMLATALAPDGCLTLLPPG